MIFAVWQYIGWISFMAKEKSKRFQGGLLKSLLDGMKEIERVQVETKFNLASNIESFLKNKGISKSEFAAKMGKSPSEISKWLSGKHNFTIDTLLEIAHALKVDIGELLKYKPAPLFETKIKVHKKKTEETPEGGNDKPEGYDDYELLD